MPRAFTFCHRPPRFFPSVEAGQLQPQRPDGYSETRYVSPFGLVTLQDRQTPGGAGTGFTR